MDEATALAGFNIHVERDGKGYRYWVTDRGVLIASGWVRTDDREYAMHLARSIGRHVVDGTRP